MAGRPALAACTLALALLPLSGCSGGPQEEGRFTLSEGGAPAPSAWAGRVPRAPLPCDAQGAAEAGPALKMAGAFTDPNATAVALAQWLGVSLGEGEPRPSGWTWSLPDGFLQVRPTRGLHGHLDAADALGGTVASARASLEEAKGLLALPDHLRLDVLVEQTAGVRTARIQQSVDGRVLADALWVQTGPDGTTIDAPGAFDVPAEAGLADPGPLRDRLPAYTACAHGKVTQASVTGPELVALDRLAWSFSEQTPGQCGWTSRSVYFDAVTGAVLESSETFATC